MAVLACALVAAVAGCGESPTDPGAAREVRSVIAASNDAFFAGDWRRTCGFYTADAQVNIVSTVPVPADNCPEAWRKLSGFLKERLSAAQLEAVRAFLPKKVEIDGDHATATFGKPPPNFPNLPAEGATLELVRENGRWLIDSLLF
jgi:hypothetical protein